LRLYARRALAGALALAMVSSSAWAAAVDDSTRNAARNLAEQGREAFDRGEFERSRDLFHRAYALVQAPTLALFEARSLAKLGRLVESQEAYLRAVRTPLTADSPEAFRKAVRDAEKEETELEPRVPKLTIVVAGPGAQAENLKVTLDREPVQPALIGVEMPINPGKHVLQAEAPGVTAAPVELSLQEAEKKSVELRVELASSPPVKVEPTPPPAVVAPDQPAASRPWQRTTAFVAGGIGVAGLATGVITGLMASSQHSKAEEQCPDHRCVEGSSGADALDSFRSLRTVSTVGYVVGAVGLAAGVTLYFTAPAPASKRGALGVFMNVGSAGITGAF